MSLGRIGFQSGWISVKTDSGLLLKDERDYGLPRASRPWIVMNQAVKAERDKRQMGRYLRFLHLVRTKITKS